MSILLPVNPPFSGWLVDGLKTVEWRKKPLPEGKAYIYDTKKSGGCGMVIGTVCIIRSTKEDVGDLFGKMYDQFSTVPDIHCGKEVYVPEIEDYNANEPMKQWHKRKGETK